MTYPQWLDDLIDEFPPADRNGNALYSISRVQRLARLFAGEDNATMQKAVDAYLNGKTYGLPRAGNLRPHVDAAKKAVNLQSNHASKIEMRQYQILSQRAADLLQAAYAGSIDDAQWQQLGRDLEAKGAEQMLHALRAKYRQLTRPIAQTQSSSSRDLAAYRQRLFGTSRRDAPHRAPTAASQPLETIRA